MMQSLDKIEQRRRTWRRVRECRWRYLMFLPAAVLLILFSYMPMVGLIGAFKDYRIGFTVRNSHESGISTDANAQRAMQLLEEHVEEGITIARLAEEVHMNASYLCTLFKKTYGISISEQLNLLQQKRACQLLATTDLSIGEIGARTGGRSASNFGQWFRKSVGMTPGDYRHLLRSSQAQDIGREHRGSDARKG